MRRQHYPNLNFAFKIIFTIKVCKFREKNAIILYTLYNKKQWNIYTADCYPVKDIYYMYSTSGTSILYILIICGKNVLKIDGFIKIRFNANGFNRENVLFFCREQSAL